jgi:hypothetical protein
MIEPMTDWPLMLMGYAYKVRVSPHVMTHVVEWCQIHLGDLDQDIWNDQADCVCFVKRKHAEFFDWVWG